MKKTIKKVLDVIGVVTTAVMLYVGVYVTFSTFMLSVYNAIFGVSWSKTRRMIANFFGLITIEEEDILNEREEIEE